MDFGRAPNKIRPFEKGDWVQVQTGVHASKEGEVVERRKSAHGYGDELVIQPPDSMYVGMFGGYPVNVDPIVVDPLKCRLGVKPSV